MIEDGNDEDEDADDGFFVVEVELTGRGLEPPGGMKAADVDPPP